MRRMQDMQAGCASRSCTWTMHAARTSCVTLTIQCHGLYTCTIQCLIYTYTIQCCALYTYTIQCHVQQIHIDASDIHTLPHIAIHPSATYISLLIPRSAITLEGIRKLRLELFRNFRKFALTFQFQRFQNLKRVLGSNRNLNFSQRDQCY